MIRARYTPFQFQAVLFYRLEGSQFARCRALEQATEALGIREPFRYADSEASLLAELAPDVLVVLPDPGAGRVAQLLYDAGVALAISLDRFIAAFPYILQLDMPVHLSEVALAFLPPHLNALVSQLFRLYGHNVTIVERLDQLQKALKQPNLYLIIDVDYPARFRNLPGRSEIFRSIKTARNLHPGLSVSAIKDFDQGSLFSDICSSVKEISNVLLSPAEYLIFLRQHLYQFHLQRTLARMQLDPASSKQVPGFAAGLNDAKRAFAVSQNADAGSRDDFHRLSLDLESLTLRDLISSWLDEYLNQTEEKKKRASFAFVSPETSNVVPFHTNRVSPRENETLSVPPDAGVSSARMSLPR